MFKVDNKDTRTTTYFTPWFSVSIVNFEQVNAGCVVRALDCECKGTGWLQSFYPSMVDQMSARSSSGISG